jgi:hypothetical protein
LPFTLFSQSNCVTFPQIEYADFAVNLACSGYTGSEDVITKSLSSAENKLPLESDNTSMIPEPKNATPSAELLNFCFECGYVVWSTASETNCSHFLIMYSRDNKGWNILGQIYGAGNSSALNNYKYPTDLFEVYFKIYQMDFNGNSKEYGPIFGSCKKQKKTN